MPRLASELRNAILSNNLQLVKQLIAQKADISEPYNGFTPEYAAVMAGSLEILSTLHEAGATINNIFVGDPLCQPSMAWSRAARPRWSTVQGASRSM